ncbi:MAG: hypothetical protein LBD48_12195 [Treponema sp.]|nr:hypothetical protein [Treponema sp.]
MTIIYKKYHFFPIAGKTSLFLSRIPLIGTLQLISTEFNVSKEWLMTGEGEMFTAPPPDVQLQKMIDIFKQLDKPLGDCLLIQSKALLKIRKEKIEDEELEYNPERR